MVGYEVEPIYKIIGQKMREAREQLGINQAELAAKVKVSTPAVTHYETATRRIPLHHLLKISKVLGKNIDYFIDATINVVMPTSAKKQLIAIVNKLSDAVYIPITNSEAFYNDPDFDFFDLSNKQLEPFPKDLATGVDLAFKEVNTKGTTYYLLNLENTPEIGDKVFMTDDYYDEEKEEVYTVYYIEEYNKLVETEKEYKAINPQLKNDDFEKIVGIVKAKIEKF